MSAKSKTLVAGLLLLGLALLLFRAWPPPQGHDAAPEEATVAAAPGVAGAAPSAPAPPAAPDPAMTRSDALAAAPAAASGAAATGGIVVRVTREADGGPVADEWVQLHAWAAPNPYFAVREERTDAAGLARFADLPAGSVSVSLHRGSGRTAATVAEIRPGVESEAALVLAAGIAVDGEVTDAGGAPVTDAEIWLSSNGNLKGGHVLARSDARGRFTLEGVGSGHWIGARKAGHAPSVMPMLVAADGSRVPVLLVLQGPGGGVRGRVLDPDGAPVAGAAVLIGTEDPVGGRLPDGSQGFRMPGPCLTSDAEGRFAADGLAPGATQVCVRASGWGLWRGETQIVPGATVQVDAQLAPGVRARGLVSLAGGGSAARARVHTGGYGFEDFSVHADGDGEYLLEDLGAGALTLFAEDAREEGRAATASFEARPGEDLIWNPTLDAGAMLTVLVVDETGAGREGCGVQIVGQSADGRPHRGFEATDRDGRARFGGCPDQAFDVEVRDAGSGIFMVARVRDVRAGGEEVRIVVERALDPSVRLRGRVLLPDGTPAAAANLGPILGTGVSPILTPDPETGAFDLGPYPPGTWQLSVRHPGLPDHRFGPRTLAPGETWDLGDLRLQEGGTLVAVIGRGAGTERAAPKLALRQGPRLDSRSLTLEHDVARSRPLAPGDYVLLWEGEGLAAGFAPVTIRAGQETVVNLALAAGLDCPLTIAEESPTELLTVELEVRDASGALVWARPVSRWREPEFRHALRLPAGEYEVSVRASDGRRAAGKVRLEPGAPSEGLRLTLQPPG